MKKVINKVKKILKLCFKPYMRILPGNVAYSLMISVIPILSIILLICNSLNLSYEFIFDKVGNIVPGNILNILLTYMEGSNFNSIVLIIIGIWGASVGANSLIISSNMIYDYEQKSYLQRRIKAYLLTVLLITVIIINLVFLVYGNELLNLILQFFGIGTGILSLFRFVKWPIALILIYFIIKVLYIFCPDKKISSKTVTHGAIFTTVTWMLSSAVYSFYVSHFANYGRVYGGLANIIILMIWLYMLSYILVVGIAINVYDYKIDNKSIKE